MIDRDFDARPYTPDERRVCDLLQKLTPDIGCGEDPIGFLIASYGMLVEERRLRRSTKPLAIEFRQQDWIPGFAAFLPGATTPDGTAFCVLNLADILATVATGDMPASDLPYFIAESMMHEIMHALEQWAGVEFSEERVEALLEKYRAFVAAQEPTP